MGAQAPEPDVGGNKRDTKPLTEADRLEVFRIATQSLVTWFAADIETGMTDQQLAKALESSLGIFGGSSGPDRLSVAHTGSGLRIWGGWHIVNHVTEKPLFAGQRTIEAARAVYTVKNPDNKQLDLF